jgi:hypothetical protein
MIKNNEIYSQTQCVFSLHRKSASNLAENPEKQIVQLVRENSQNIENPRGIFFPVHCCTAPRVLFIHRRNILWTVSKMPMHLHSTPINVYNILNYSICNVHLTVPVVLIWNSGKGDSSSLVSSRSWPFYLFSYHTLTFLS